MRALWQWVVFVGSCLVVPAALYGLWTLFGWHGTTATWALIIVGLPLTFLLLRWLYGRTLYRR